MPNTTTGLLLLNIGTPEAPTQSALRSYLREFLSDPQIVDYPSFIWQPILQQIILRVRPRKSARLYQEIWTEAGSPLLTLSESLAAKLAGRWPELHVQLGMRYGKPSIEQGLRALRAAKVEHLMLMPLFPQYSLTTTRTSLDKAQEFLAGELEFEQVRIVEPYFEHPAYIGALAASIRASWEGPEPPQQSVFSYHGVPQRYVGRKGDPYYAQCLATSELLAKALDLDPSQWTTSFQSRFGPEPWLQPYTDKLLASLGGKGAASLKVVCPGFALDCLETLEEINIQGRRAYEQAGGKGFGYVPALNDSELQVNMLSEILADYIEP